MTLSQGKDKKMLITGATGGMGLACALLAASRGYELLLTDLNPDKLMQLAQECRLDNVPVTYQVLDIADTAAVDAYLDQLGEHGSLDAVIHTVGLSPQMTDGETIVKVDLIDSVSLLEKLKPLLNPGGSAVCISSMSAHMVPPNPEVESILSEPLSGDVIERLQQLPGDLLSNSGFAYAYAKKALLHYVSSQAMAWGQEGKRITSISPGLIQTPMGQLEEEGDQDGYANMRPMIALQRDGLPEEIATAALFLASDEASYISGCDLLVDGGFVASFRSR